MEWDTIRAEEMTHGSEDDSRILLTPDVRRFLIADGAGTIEEHTMSPWRQTSAAGLSTSHRC